jgi:RHS repeat-associated protein
MQRVVGNGDKPNAAPSPVTERSVRLDGAEEFVQWSSNDYQYDGSGNIWKIGTDDFRYDLVNRLKRATIDVDGETVQEDYGYDVYGNMIAKTIDGVPGASFETNPATNQLTTMSYDEAGNVTRHGTDYFFWSSAGDLKEMWYGSWGQSGYVYTPDDERIGVVRNDWWLWTVRDFNGKVIREYETVVHDPGYGVGQGWMWNEDFVHANGKILGAEREPEFGGRRHFHTDHLGSARMVSTYDGYRLTKHKYYPFGVEATPSTQAESIGFPPNKLKFTGHERDVQGSENVENTNYLDYMHARYYNPNFARFLSVDPLVGYAEVPQSWNRYAYVTGNPVLRFDPFGLEGCQEGEDLTKEGCTAEVETSALTWSADAEKRRIRHIRRLFFAGAYLEASKSVAKEFVRAIPETFEEMNQMLSAPICAPEIQCGVIQIGSLRTPFVKFAQAQGHWSHGARHVARVGLSPQRVETAIVRHVEAATRGSSITGEFYGRLVVDGVVVQYKAIPRPGGVVSVGTYWVP